MATETAESDMAAGLAIALSAGVLVGAGFMLVGATQSVKAWGFALAMLTAALAVVAVQAFDR
ncbi:DUF7525 family protein [Candidatus Halobonum tyrrellensis]|uniref:Uncharacterized protein n=1 Tax=Candidatus Halobonum tyrrellensis G22 TaxID=1324957 RepID=V4HAZ6_9EURY|nr:hypothetical protein [Candidatus Halobonum tyrrellensis]ESP87855.1 hypothetical protein K933_11871 [Candidatus Halobonum tyrrellensis G22]